MQDNRTKRIVVEVIWKVFQVHVLKAVYNPSVPAVKLKLCKVKCSYTWLDAHCFSVHAISVCHHRFVQSKSNSTRQLLEFILQLQIFEQVMVKFLYAGFRINQRSAWLNLKIKPFPLLFCHLLQARNMTGILVISNCNWAYNF